MNCENSHIWMQIFGWKLIISSLKKELVSWIVSPPHRGNPMNKCHDQNNNQLTSRPSLYCISSQLVSRSSAWCAKQTNVTSEKQCQTIPTKKYYISMSINLINENKNNDTEWHQGISWNKTYLQVEIFTEWKELVEDQPSSVE